MGKVTMVLIAISAVVFVSCTTGGVKMAEKKKRKEKLKQRKKKEVT